MCFGSVFRPVSGGFFRRSTMKSRFSREEGILILRS